MKITAKNWTGRRNWNFLLFTVVNGGNRTWKNSIDRFYDFGPANWLIIFNETKGPIPGADNGTHFFHFQFQTITTQVALTYLKWSLASQCYNYYFLVCKCLVLSIFKVYIFMAIEEQIKEMILVLLQVTFS